MLRRPGKKISFVAFRILVVDNMFIELVPSPTDNTQAKHIIFVSLLCRDW
jgi:hypothetical protein